MSLPPLGLYTDKDCLEWLESKPFLEPGTVFETLSRPQLLETHPVLKHLVEGTPQALFLEMKAPDGPLVPLSQPDTTKNLHDIVQQDFGTRFVLLNFGSFS